MLGWNKAGSNAKMGRRFGGNKRTCGSRRSRLFLGLWGGLLACLAPATALAVAKAHFAGIQTHVNTVGFAVGSGPKYVAVDASGNVYLASNDAGVITKETLQADGTYAGATIASGGTNGSCGGLGLDAAGNVYATFTSASNVHSIFKYTGSGNTYSGTPITTTILTTETVYDLAVSSAGDVYVLAVGSTSGRVVLYANGGYTQTAPITGLGTTVYGLTLDPTGNLFVTGNDNVTEFAAGTYSSSVVATGVGSSGDHITTDSVGNLYITNFTANIILKETYSGGTYTQSIVDAGYSAPEGIAVDSAGNVYTANEGAYATRLSQHGVNFGLQNVDSPKTLPVRFIFDVAGTIQAPLAVAQGATAKDFAPAPLSGSCKTNGTSQYYNVGDVCTANVIFTPTAPGLRSGASILVDSTTAPIATAPVYGIGVAPQPALDAARISTLPITLAGTGSSTIIDVKTDSAGNLYLADYQRCVVERVPAAGGTAVTVAGTGTCGYSGDGGPATAANFNGPGSVAVNGRGDLYIADFLNYVVRKVDAFTGMVSVVAGTPGSRGNGPAGVPATSTTIYTLNGLALDGSGNLYISNAPSLVQRVDALTGILTTVAGNQGLGPGYSGDGGAATAAQINSPVGIAVDSAGNLYIAESGNSIVRKVTASTGVISTVAGQFPNSCTHGGDEGPATSANLCDPEGVAVDGGGNLYIADSSNNVIRKVDPLGTIHALAGIFNSGVTGEGGSALLAGLGYESALGLDPNGNLFLVDGSSNTVHKVTPAVGVANFASTYLTNSSSALDVKLTNNGNASVSLTSLTPSTNFNLGGADTTCTGTTSLAAGASCTLGIVFAPTAVGAPLTGTVAFGDNAYPELVRPVINLSGTGLALPDTQTAIAGVPATLSSGSTVGTVTVSLEDANGALVTQANVPVTVTITGPFNYTHTTTVTASAGIASFNLGAVPLSNAGLYTFTATSTGLTSSQATTSVADRSSQITLTLSSATTAPATPVLLTATPTAAGSPITQGTVTFNYQTTLYGAVVAGTFGPQQLTSAGTSVLAVQPGPGTYTVTATFIGTEGINPVTSAPHTLTVTGPTAPYTTVTNIAATGIPGNYTLAGTVAEFGLLPAPSGTVNFLDTTANPNLTVATASIDPATFRYSMVPIATPPTVNSPADLAIADVNHDGIADIVAMQADANGYSLGTVTVQVGLGNGLYGPATTYTVAPPAGSPSTHSEPQFNKVYLADVSGDGNADILLVTGQNGLQSEVFILLGDGAGNFTLPAPAQILTTVSGDLGFGTLTTGDFNGDGKMDIAVVTNGVSRVTMFLGNGDGTFRAPMDSALSPGGGPYFVSAGDVNQDGILDVLTSNINAGSIDVALGKGDGTFQAPVPVVLPIDPVAGIVYGNMPQLGSLRGNGVLDLAVADGPANRVDVFLGNNDGTFGTAAFYTVPQSIYDSMLVDADHDGKLDLVILANDSSYIASVWVLPGKGDGTFGAPQSTSLGYYCGGALHAADLNNDGLIDFICTDRQDGVTPIALGAQLATATATGVPVPGPLAQDVEAVYAGDGTHTTSTSGRISLLPVLTTTVLTATPPSAVLGTPILLTATVNATVDGLQNAGTVSFYNFSGTTLLGTANVVAGVASLTVTPAAGNSTFYAVYSGSAVAGGSTSPHVQVFVGPQSSTTLAVSTTTAVLGTPVILTATGLNVPASTPLTPGSVTFNYVETLGTATLPGSFGTVQMTGAGTAVLAVEPGPGTYVVTAVFAGTSLVGPSSSAPQTVTITGNGSFATTATLTETGVVGDYNLVATISGFGAQAPTGTVSFLNTTTPLTVASAAIDPASAVSSLVVGSASPLPNPGVTWVAAGDLNNDGIPDLVSVTSTAKLYSRLGNGDGTFQSPVAAPLHSAYYYTQAALGDFNNDGKLDVLAVSTIRRSVDLYLGNGDGTFGTWTKFSITGSGNTALALVTGDFNNDGKLDFAFLNSNDGTLRVFVGNGVGSFTARPTISLSSTYVGSSTLTSMVVGDFNADGNLDLAIGDNTGDVAIMNGDGTGAFAEGAGSFTTYFAGTVTYMATGSVRNNGILDLIVPDADNGGFSVFLGNGDGTFTPTAASPLATYSYLDDTLLVDVNHDGFLDVVGTDSYDNQVAVFLGAGDGTFTAGTYYQPGTGNNSIATADFTHDGLPDFVTTNSVDGTSTVYLGLQSATATAKAAYALGTGPQSVNAHYPGDTTHAASDSAPVTLQPSVQAPSTTLLAASSTTLIQGSSVTFTATIEPVPTGASFGTVSFYSNGALLATQPVLANGQATYTTIALPVGPDAITAIFSGNANFATSSAPAVTVGVFLATLTTLTASLPGSNFGQAVALTATVAPTPAGSPLGTVFFYAGTTQVGTGSVDPNGVATVTLTSLPVGTLSLTAAYQGNLTYATSTSAGVSFTVAALTATTLSASTLTPAYGKAFTVTATIVPAPTSTPSGSVSFYNGTTLLGTSAVNAGGSATFSVTGLSVGAATITAVFSSSAGFAGSTSAALAINVVAAPTATTLTSSNLTPLFGQAITLTATVAPVSTDPAKGSVNFFSGTTLLGTATINAGGVATLTGVVLPIGLNAVKATYNGSSNFAASTSAALNVSARTTSAISFSASPTTQLFNNPITLTAQVSSATPGTPSGTVTVLDGTNIVCTAPVNTSGQAVCTSTALSDGSHTLTAMYSGDASFLPSTSTGTPIAITVADLDLSLGNDNNKTVHSGDPVTYNFPLSPLVTPTFIYDVALTATGLPPGATYTFSPAKIPAGSGTLPVAFTVQTAAPGTASLRLTPPGSAGRWSTLAILFLLPLAGTRRFRARLKNLPRPLAMLLAGAISLGLMTGLSGCGAGGFFGDPLHGKSFTITVHATSANLVRTSTVQLNFE